MLAGDLVGICMGTDQRRVSGFRSPLRMVCWSKEMSTVSLLNVAMHPTSHSCPTDNKECGVKDGNRCARVADCGIIGI
jgi:hypothetical protein